MLTNKEIDAGAKAIAEDFALSEGRIKKLARVVEGHLDWFDACEMRGMTWADIARLLFVAGAKGRNGRPFTVGTLSSTVWRKRRNQTKAASTNRSHSQKHSHRHTRAGQSDVASAKVSPDRKRAPHTRDWPSHPPVPRQTKQRISPKKPADRKSPKVEFRASSHAAPMGDARTRMKRAAAVRQRKEEEL